MNKEPITLLGLEKLKKELVFLKEKKRPEIVAAIAEARSHGDLKENAEYHSAKEEQSHNEGRITEINDIIARANVIDVTNLDNDKSIILRINDRGPYVGKRILDCSYGAAKKLDFLDKGTANVKINIIEWGDGEYMHHEYYI